MVYAINRFYRIGRNIFNSKLLQNVNFVAPKPAMCCAKELSKGLAIAGKNYPAEYISLVSREYVPEVYEHFSYSKFLKQWCYRQSEPAHFEETYQFTPHIMIAKLWSGGAGTGTKAVQNVVKESLNNPRTRGRVLIDACCIDGKTAPGGFYYKLGFRFTNSIENEKCAEWLAAGGMRENAPFATGSMYLPRENIEHCLKYGLDSQELLKLKPELDFYRASGLI